MKYFKKQNGMIHRLEISIQKVKEQINIFLKI